MGERFRLSDAEVSLLYWQARIAFGEAALNKVLSQSPWRDRFPNVAELARSADVPTMQAANATILPGELLDEVAGSDKRANDFFVDSSYGDPKRARLYSAPHTSLAADSWNGHVYCGLGVPISAQDALLEFGAYALFYSVDSLYGERWFRDPMREYLKRED